MKQKNIINWLIFISISLFATNYLITEINNSSNLYKNLNLSSSIIGSLSTPEYYSNIPKLTKQLLNYSKKVQNATNKEKIDLTQKMFEVASLRKNEMLKKIKNNTEEFLLQTLPSSLIEKLPEEIHPFLEKELEIEGELEVFIEEDIEKNYHKEFYVLKDKNSGNNYNLYFSKGKPNLLTGSKIKAKGIALENNLAIASADEGGGITTIQALTGGPTGEQRLLAMLVNFTNDTSQPWTPIQVAQKLFFDSLSLNNYYKEVSFNKTYFTGDVTNWITIPYTNENCSSNYDTWANAADKIAKQLGYDLSQYNRKLYIFNGDYCPWSGLSNVGGNPSRSWSDGYNNVSLYTHELGHALGMYHASTIQCGNKSIDYSNQCTVYEYGDQQDTMGSWNTFHLNSPHKTQQTYLTSNNVQEITTNGTYTVYAQEIPGDNIKSLKIKRKDLTNYYYYIEYRQPYGFDKNLSSTFINGVTIHMHDGYSQTYRIDGTPGDKNLTNPSLSDGLYFEDQINGIRVTQLSHDSEKAVVRVDFETVPCTMANPTITVSPLSQEGTPGETLYYNISIKNNDNFSCTTSNFRVTAINLPSGFTSDSPTINLSPGSSGTVKIGITSPLNQADGSYTFTIKAYNSSNENYYATTNATYVVYTPYIDTIAPTVKIINPVNEATISDSLITIQVLASDNIKVDKVEIYIDNVLKTVDKTIPYNYKWQTRKYDAGSYTIKAIAYDTAGNISSDTIIVYKK